MTALLQPTLVQHLKHLTPNDLMPVVFVGHGSPMNAIETNSFTQTWRELGKVLPTPKAILVISAHWVTNGATHVLTSVEPRTIYDFYGFPKQLYEPTYPASGNPTLAQQIMDLVTHPAIQADSSWGFDHGAWSVLLPMYPDASIPVIQLSMDVRQTPKQRYELGQALQLLRSQGVLVMGSGNLVHNLRLIDFNLAQRGYDWARAYDQQLTALLDAGDDEALVNFKQLPNTALAHPTPDHYWPLLYCLGLKSSEDQVWYFNEALDLGSLSMRSVIFS